MKSNKRRYSIIGKKLGKFLKTEYFIVALVTGIAFCFYCWIFTEIPLTESPDGPYYLIQVKSLIENHCLKHEDPPLALLLFALSNVLLGDATLGIELTVAFFSAISAVPFYFWVKSSIRDKYGAFAAMLLFIFLGHHTRLITIFYKNAVGIFFLVLFLYYFTKMGTEGTTLKNTLFASLFLILTGATHILDFAVALLFVITYTTISLLMNLNRKNFLRAAAISFFISGQFAIFAFMLSPDLSSDIQRLPTTIPYLLQNNQFFIYSPLFSTQAKSFFLNMTVISIMIVGLLLALFCLRHARKSPQVLHVFSIAIVGLVLSVPFIPYQFLDRFFLMQFITISFVLGYVFSKLHNMNLIKTLLLLLLLFIGWTLVLQSIMFDKMGPWVSPAIEGMVKLESAKSVILPNSVIIVTDSLHGFRYWTEYVTECDTVMTLSPNLWQTYQHVLMIYLRGPLPLEISQQSTRLFEDEKFVLLDITSWYAVKD